ncbi:MAG: hypothetical protein Q8O66_02580 [bacterium]|nr:hypothetical protein [bacterium]
MGATILFLFIIWLALGWVIETGDTKENKNWAEFSYSEQNKKYEIIDGNAFEMNYVYDVKINVGFLSGGGFTENGCWKRYIIEAGASKEIMLISLCEDEKITKEKLETLNNFWKEYEKIFRSKDRIRADYFKEHVLY